MKMKFTWFGEAVKEESFESRRRLRDLLLLQQLRINEEQVQERRQECGGRR